MCTEDDNILLTISYDGTDFCGWQKQTKHGLKTCRTIQDEIETSLEKILKRKTEIYGSGRTDSGVHAVGQIANFFSPVKSMKEENYVQALNSILPSDIRIIGAKKVDARFNARFSSKARTYRYFCNTQKFTLAHLTRYAWNIRYTPNLILLNRMANLLRGEMDFTSFAASGDASKSKNRYVEAAFFFMENEMLVFEITANAFLWHMVRSLLGTILELEKKGKNETDFARILVAKDRKKAGLTAPAKGLFLWKVLY
ncbi:MAG: tRNA pseudouridine(38-40) synthase TruA [Treponemataceae bacterium]